MITIGLTLLQLLHTFLAHEDNSCDPPDVNCMCPLEGKAVKFSSTKTVYQVEKCLLREFPNAETFLKMGYEFSNVQTFSDDVSKYVELGKPIPPYEEPETVVPAPSNIAELLSEIRIKVNESAPKCQKYGFTTVAADYVSNRWHDIIRQQPVLVYPSCMNVIYFGNHIGTYLNEVSCANRTGAHFVSVPTLPAGDSEGHHQDPFAHNSTLHHMRQKAFIDALPTIIVHDKPLSPVDVNKKVRKLCNCQRYCWDNPHAPWVKNVPQIRDILHKASDAYLHHDTQLMSRGTVLDPGRDQILLPQDPADAHYVKQEPEHTAPSQLPLIPDVTVQYRCSDNLGYNYGAMGYGILPFRAITARISDSDRYIYILAEAAERTHPNPFCGVIVQSLMKYIHRRFPLTTVVLKRGGDPLLDYVRIINSKTSICSCSTFCFYAGLASLGTCHFPLTNLIIQADPSVTTRDNAPDFGPNFRWIFETEALFNFKKATSELLDMLQADAPSSAPTTEP